MSPQLLHELLHETNQRLEPLLTQDWQGDGGSFWILEDLLVSHYHLRPGAERLA
jgi:hypothetical protein